MTTPPTLAPPVLVDPNTGQRWAFAADTEHCPAYAPQQPALLADVPQALAAVVTTGPAEWVFNTEGE